MAVLLLQAGNSLLLHNGACLTASLHCSPGIRQAHIQH